MGEVYRAADTNLKRQVAIKVLPASVATDADRLARFQREAEVLAALNHPNIAHIFGVEKAGGTFALAMELVEGPTLADRIARGAVPLDDAIPIAKQIADALESAHEQGIIHRDLKPANIKLRDDGTVKVLDFGLAKALDQDPRLESAGSRQAVTVTSPAVTAAGIILGTAAYMAPEQAKGRSVDARADIWAFGCVLFEMLVGRAPFAGESVVDILSTVIQRDPEWSALDVRALATTPPPDLRRQDICSSRVRRARHGPSLPRHSMRRRPASLAKSRCYRANVPVRYATPAVASAAGDVDAGQGGHFRPRVPGAPQYLNLVSLEHVDHPFPRRRLNLRRSSDPVGLPAGDQNFRKERDQSFRNPQMPDASPSRTVAPLRCSFKLCLLESRSQVR